MHCSFKRVGVQTGGRAKNKGCTWLGISPHKPKSVLGCLQPVIQVKGIKKKKPPSVLQTVLETVVGHMKEPDFSAP